MTKTELEIVARVLARWRPQSISVVAAITCDLSDALRAETEGFDYLGYWNEIELAKREAARD